MAIHHQSITFDASLGSVPVRARHLSGMNTHGLGLEPLMGVEELAEYLGVSVQTIYDCRVAGTAPRAIKCGKRLKFAVSDVRTWLETRHEADR